MRICSTLVNRICFTAYLRESPIDQEVSLLAPLLNNVAICIKNVVFFKRSKFLSSSTIAHEPVTAFVAFIRNIEEQYVIRRKGEPGEKNSIGTYAFVANRIN